MKRAAALAASLVALGLLLVAPPSGGAGGAKVVKIEDIDFTPKSVSVRKGATVRWDFLDKGVSHNVISRGTPRFTGSPVKSRGSYRVTFRTSGTYRYVCTLHLGMAGRVVVR